MSEWIHTRSGQLSLARLERLARKREVRSEEDIRRAGELGIIDTRKESGS